MIYQPKPLKKDKGKKHGSCNRTACQSPVNVVYYNKETRAYYCPGCARKINHWSNIDVGMDICTKDSAPK